MKIVAFVAPKGGGKDTCADLLREMSISAGKLSFAGPMKNILVKTTGLAVQLMHDPVHKETELKEPIVLTSRLLRRIRKECELFLDPTRPDGTLMYRTGVASIAGIENQVMKTPRQLMQFIGKEFIRDRIYQDWHIEAAFQKKVMDALKPNGVYCVTDVRFLNEYEFLKKRFGDDFVCFYVEREEAEERLKTATHESELEILKIKAKLSEDSILKNDGSLDDLKTKLKSLDLKPKKAAPGSRLKYVDKKGNPVT